MQRTVRGQAWFGYSDATQQHQQQRGAEMSGKSFRATGVVVSVSSSPLTKKGVAQMAAIPNVSQMYGGDPALTDNVPTPNSSVGTPKPSKLAARHESYKKSIAAAINEGLRGDVIETGRVEGLPVPLVRSKRVHQQELARGYDQSGLQKGSREILAEHMAYLEKSGGMLSKEWTQIQFRQVSSRMI
jgi:hypothetical protein